MKSEAEKNICTCGAYIFWETTRSISYIRDIINEIIMSLNTKGCFPDASLSIVAFESSASVMLTLWYITSLHFKTL
jgi:hypothetical protein